MGLGLRLGLSFSLGLCLSLRLSLLLDLQLGLDLLLSLGLHPAARTTADTVAASTTTGSAATVTAAPTVTTTAAAVAAIATVTTTAAAVATTVTTTTAVAATVTAAARQNQVTFKQGILDIGDRRCLIPAAVVRQQVRRNCAPGREGQEQHPKKTYQFLQKFSFHFILLYLFLLTKKSDA
jgi:hypothetical protein